MSVRPGQSVTKEKKVPAAVRPWQLVTKEKVSMPVRLGHLVAHRRKKIGIGAGLTSAANRGRATGSQDPGGRSQRSEIQQFSESIEGPGDPQMKRFYPVGSPVTGLLGY